MTKMEVKLQLGVFMLLLPVSLAGWQHVMVMKGQALHLRCPLTDAHKTSVEWRNPDNYLMFFNKNKALKDKRYSIDRLSDSEFTISVSNVTFKDGGNYTCSQYGHKPTETKVLVTVLGLPKMKVTKHRGKFVIHCTAEGNHHPPQISWKFDHEPEFSGGPAQFTNEGKKYVSMDLLYIESVDARHTVKCLARHPYWHSHPLMNFVKVGPNPLRPTTTNSSPTSQPQTSLDVLRKTSQWSKGWRTTSSANHPTSSSEPVSEPTDLPQNTVTLTSSYLNTDRTPVSVITASFNSTEGNQTVSSNYEKMQAGNRSLLVILVACLITGLLVVVLFIAIKIRRAHVTWKRGNLTTLPLLLIDLTSSRLKL